MTGGAEVVGVDISGRHEEGGEYLMVAAAVAARVDTNRLISVDGIGFATSRLEPTLENTIAVVSTAVDRLPVPPNGPVIAERGEFYEEPAWTVESSFSPGIDFKYEESIAERRTVEAAHHAAYAARSLLIKPHHAENHTEKPH